MLLLWGRLSAGMYRGSMTPSQLSQPRRLTLTQYHDDGVWRRHEYFIGFHAETYFADGQWGLSFCMSWKHQQFIHSTWNRLPSSSSEASIEISLHSWLTVTKQKKNDSLCVSKLCSLSAACSFILLVKCLDSGEFEFIFLNASQRWQRIWRVVFSQSGNVVRPKKKKTPPPLSVVCQRPLRQWLPPC